MNTRTLGADLTVSAVGLGCMGFSHAYGAPTEQKEAVRAILSLIHIYGYRNFGWKFEGASAQEAGSGAVRLKFKRDRRIPSKAELTRLQRQFDACALEIEALERSRTTAAAIAAFTIGLAGTAFLGGAVFAYLNGLLPLMVVLAVPGFLCWIAPYFCYQKIRQRRTEQVSPIIEQKNDEIYSVCEQGCRLLTA